MFQAFQYRRLTAFAIVLLAGFGLLEWKLFETQALRHEELAAKARDCLRLRTRVPALRGEMRDRLERPIAMTEPLVNIFVNPCLLGDRAEEMARLLAPWLGIAPATLAATKLTPRLLWADEHGRSIYDNKVPLKRGASLEEWAWLQRALQQHTFGLNPATPRARDRALLRRLRKRAIFAEDDQRRVYPQEGTAWHWLGLVNHDPATGLFLPQGGLEKTLDPLLAGTPGYREGVHDGQGDEILSRRTACRNPVDGVNLVLTIDAVLQHLAEVELQAGLDRYQAEGAVAIMVRPSTGEILALVSLPGYRLDDRRTVPSNAWRHRAICDLYEPGSVFKIVTYAAALQEGLFTWTSWVNCGNDWAGGRRHPLSDHGHRDWVPAWKALAESVNSAAARIGLDLGTERLCRYVSDFGFCAPTGLGLEEERSARIKPAQKKSVTALTRLAIGYGVEVTPLQMAMAMSALANEGRLMRPLLVLRAVDNQGRVLSNNVPKCVRTVVSPATARQMAVGLQAVTSKEGTGYRARSDRFSVAGKTGTARMVKNRKYQPGCYRATFAGFLPANGPAQLCLLVMYDCPRTSYYGGHTAAPVFRRIAEQAADYLRLAPDLAPGRAAAPGEVASAARD